MEVEIRVNVQPDEVYVTANTPEETPVEPMIEDKTTTKISYTVTGLTDGASYLFRVKAKNKQGVSEPLLMKERISTHMIKGIVYFLIIRGLRRFKNKES